MGDLVSALYLLLALVLSLLIIPQAIRLAPVLGMVDRPGARKVHQTPMARVGGIGIVVGSVVALMFAISLDALAVAYVLGTVVLFFFGIADDRFELGHYTKFIGQFVAVGLVVIYGDLVVSRVPFLHEPLPAFIGIPFTIIAMVGVINAFNHADGLDGLAGGEALLSLLGAALIAYWSDDQFSLNIALVAIGGLIGFLRYNNHPARVFMGDAGSQYLGFTVAFLAVYITQHGNTALSAATPLLLIGLPVIDILTVLYLRISGGLHWFKASRNHFHHRLLDLGFVHGESVVIIYAAQLLFVLMAISTRYHPDTVVLGFYAVTMVGMFLLLRRAEMRGWRAQHWGAGVRATIRLNLVQGTRFAHVPIALLTTLIVGYLIVGAGSLSKFDEAWTGLLMSGVSLLVLASLAVPGSLTSTLTRLGGYTGVLLLTYAQYQSGISQTSLEIAFFAVTAVVLIIAMRLSPKEAFRTNPLDYLIGMLLLVLLILRDQLALGAATTALIVESVILLYAVEFLMTAGPHSNRIVRTSLGVVLGTVAVRHLL
jgi:UDP-GlcNAc:undecaprenyl-phosphate GlcNAc-1-phosphate transferase